MAKTSTPGVALGAGGSREDQLPSLLQRDAGVHQVGGAKGRHGLPREGGEIHLYPAGHQSCVGRDAVALLDHEHVAGHQAARLEQLLPAIAENLGLGRQVAGESLDRALGLELLREREARVDEDHHHDRDRDGHDAGHQRQSGGHPQEQCERVHKLGDELSRPAASTPADEHVRPVLGQPAFGLAGGETRWGSPQVAHERVDLLRGVDEIGRSGLCAGGVALDVRGHLWRSRDGIQ